VQRIRLRKKGKNPNRFVSAIATFAAKAARSGRRLCGQEKAKDALSPRAHYRCGFTVCSLPAFSTLTVNPFAEALLDNTRTPVSEQVAFRLDFPMWLSTFDERRQRIIESMGQGERTLDLPSSSGSRRPALARCARTHGRLAAVRRGLLMLCADRRGQTLSDSGPAAKRLRWSLRNGRILPLSPVEIGCPLCDSIEGFFSC